MPGKKSEPNIIAIGKAATIGSKQSPILRDILDIFSFTKLHLLQQNRYFLFLLLKLLYIICLIK